MRWPLLRVIRWRCRTGRGSTLPTNASGSGCLPRGVEDIGRVRAGEVRGGGINPYPLCMCYLALANLKPPTRSLKYRARMQAKSTRWLLQDGARHVFQTKDCLVAVYLAWTKVVRCVSPRGRGSAKRWLKTLPLPEGWHREVHVWSGKSVSPWSGKHGVHRPGGASGGMECECLRFMP